MGFTRQELEEVYRRSVARSDKWAATGDWVRLWEPVLARCVVRRALPG
jgi:hypothetical protein